MTQIELRASLHSVLSPQHSVLLLVRDDELLRAGGHVSGLAAREARVGADAFEFGVGVCVAARSAGEHHEAEGGGDGRRHPALVWNELKRQGHASVLQRRANFL